MPLSLNEVYDLTCVNHLETLDTVRVQVLGGMNISYRDIMNQTLATSINVSEDRLSSDARLFLTLNMDHMIARPLFEAGHIDSHNIITFMDAIDSDTRRIVEYALEQFPEGEISAGDMLQAVATLYSELLVIKYWPWSDHG